MAKRRDVKPMFRLSSVVFKNSPIAGRGVFASKRFEPGDVVTAYAPKQRRVDVGSPEAAAAAETKLTLLSGGRYVIIPDTSVPGGWLCNHSCAPNAAIYSDDAGRIQCTRPIAPGEEVTIFYGWVTRNEPERDPCLCGSPSCRGFINFDVSSADAAAFHAGGPSAFREKLDEYEAYLSSIGQEQVFEIVSQTLQAMR